MACRSFPAACGGLGHLLGQTGGYLVAFPAAAFITGAFAEHDWDRRFPTAVAAMAIGSVVIMLSGWAWFSLLTNTPMAVAFKLTVLQFLPGDIIKIVLAAAALTGRLGTPEAKGLSETLNLFSIANDDCQLAFARIQSKFGNWKLAIVRVATAPVPTKWPLTIGRTISYLRLLKFSPQKFLLTTLPHL